MMDFFKHDHAVLRGLLVGAVVLASASACSRPDRAETGNSDNGVIAADTAYTEGQSAVTPPSGDTTTTAKADTGSGTAPANAPRAATGTSDTESGSLQDTTAAGYREMERDTSAGMAAPRDSARVTADSADAPSEQSSVAEDTSAASVEMAGAAAVQDSAANSATGSSELTSDTSTTMASDTSATIASDTSATIASDTSATPEQSDTAMAAGQVEIATQENADSAGVVDAAVASSDTTVAVGDSANVAKTGDRLDPVVASAEVNDTLTQPEGTPIRPPEDSAEVYGNVNPDAAAAARTEDAATDEVGAATIGGQVNGADAVALMTRQGVQCIVADPGSAQGAAVDMSETPATVNPCGLGSMVLTRIWTKQE